MDLNNIRKLVLQIVLYITDAHVNEKSKAGIDLAKDSFAHGQLYVACSRARKASSVFLDQANQTPNIVYKEIFL